VEFAQSWLLKHTKAWTLHNKGY